jgi:hypothetical protein
MTEATYEREYWQDPTEPIVGPPSKGNGTWVIHHPGGGTTAPGAVACIKHLRAMQSSYINSRGYSLGYSYTVNQDGTSWGVRGRYINNAANAGKKVVGNFNDGSKSIQLMATEEEASPDAILEINRIIATEPTWKVITHGDVDYTSCCGPKLTRQVRDGIIGQQSIVTAPQKTSAYAPIAIDGYNPPVDWWLFPIDSNKPTLRLGSPWSPHVQYARHVIYYYAGGDIELTGPFDEKMERRVKDLQTYLGFPTAYVDGVIGNDSQHSTWKGCFDFIVQLNMAVVPKEAPTTNVTVAVTDCKYYINKDDTPWSVSSLAYGSGVKNSLLDHTKFNMYSTPGYPVFVTTPNIKGSSLTVQPGEGVYSILRRLGHETSSIDTFYTWNGGWERVLHAGDRVYMPD